MAFETGAIVYLKVGSPPLLVNGMRRSDGLVTVEWFENQSLFRRESFDPECLFEETPELAWLREASRGTAQAKLAEFGPERVATLGERLHALENRVNAELM